ncbi:MAG: hypothetical protein J1E29_05005 [Duncaniella sp.]|nr:hypothetical protein [Duncaniella sp.]
MNISTRRISTAQVIIIFCLLTAGIFTFLRSHYRELSGDDILYSFVLNTDHYGGYWKDEILTEQISNISQIFDSQANHYVYGNGRYMVHFIEQLFTGVIGLDAYNILGALMMMGMIIGIVLLSIPKSNRGNPIWWLLTVIALMYAFPYPDRLWYSINMSCNYLIPSFLLILTLIFLRIINNPDSTNGMMALAAIISFMCGASHEAFALPLTGAVWVYYIFHFSKFRSRGWIIALPLAIGSLTILASPGNWSRVAIYQNEGSFISNTIQHIFISLNTLIETPIVWIFLIVTIIVRICIGRKIWKIFSNRPIETLTIVFGVCFLAMINAWSYAYTPVYLIVFILSLNKLSTLKFLKTTNGRLIAICWIGLAGVFSCQILIAANCCKMSNYQRRLIEEYKHSRTGIILNNPPKVDAFTKTYVTIWPKEQGTDVIDLNFSAAYGEYTKPMYLLAPDEYQVITEGTTQLNKMPGGSPFVKAGRFYWAEIESLDSTTQGFELEYRPVDFNHATAPFLLRLKFALSPGAYPSRDKAETDTITIGNRTFLRIRVPDIRKVKSIKALQN